MGNQPPTSQLEAWTSKFGKECTDRNTIVVEDMDRDLGKW